LKSVALATPELNEWFGEMVVAAVLEELAEWPDAPTDSEISAGDTSIPDTLAERARAVLKKTVRLTSDAADSYRRENWRWHRDSWIAFARPACMAFNGREPKARYHVAHLMCRAVEGWLFGSSMFYVR